MHHLEGRKVIWRSGNGGKGRQHKQSEETQKKEREVKKKNTEEKTTTEKLTNPRNTISECAGIDGHRGMRQELNCTKRATKHYKHCPGHKQQHLARLGIYNIHLRAAAW